MIVALYALAAAMMIGGIASVIQGFPFVRLESGLAMTIAGATVAAAGAVLLGLAAVVSALKRVEGALGFRRLADEARPTAADAGRDAFVPEVVSLTPPPASSAVPVAGLAGLAGIGVAAGASALGETAPRASREPVFDGSALGAPGHPEPALPGFEPAERAPEPEPAAIETAHEDPIDAPRHPEAEPKLPLPTPPLHAVEPLPEPALHRHGAAEPEPDLAATEEDDLFVVPAPLPEGSAPHPEPVPEAEEVLPLRPALAHDEPAAQAEAEPEPHTHPERPADSQPPAREVVGTYASGGNTYVMYSDGAIEAETPRGRFTFASLDELKAFVDGGGEADRGAA